MFAFRADPAWRQEPETTLKQVVNDPLAVIYNESQWRISLVSPLYNLQYNTVKLKQYGTKIRQTLVSTVAANSSLKYTIQIEALPMLKYSEEDSNGLSITVLSQLSTNKTKVAYVGILLSWGISSHLEEATHLPYLLERGEQKVSNAVKSTLQTVFDCTIKQFSFTQQQLLQFGFSFLDSDTSKGSDPFALSYTTPNVDHKNKVHFCFDVGDVNIIWNGIKDETSKPSELVTLAYQILQNQILYMITLDITVLDLCEVALPKAEVKSNGSVKMRTPEIVNAVFSVLNDICSSTIN